ncbi:MAM domain protein, partial [Teladorsagia circumcincta]
GFAYVGRDHLDDSNEVFVLESPKFEISSGARLTFDVYLRSHSPQLKVCIDSFDDCPYHLPPLTKQTFWQESHAVNLAKGVRKRNTKKKKKLLMRGSTASTCQPPLGTPQALSSGISPQIDQQPQMAMAYLPSSHQVEQSSRPLEPISVGIEQTNSIAEPTLLHQEQGFTPYPGYIPPPPASMPAGFPTLQGSATLNSSHGGTIPVPSLSDPQLFVPSNQESISCNFEDGSFCRFQPTSSLFRIGKLPLPSHYATLAELSGRSVVYQPQRNFVYMLSQQTQEQQLEDQNVDVIEEFFNEDVDTGGDSRRKDVLMRNQGAGHPNRVDGVVERSTACHLLSCNFTNDTCGYRNYQNESMSLVEWQLGNHRIGNMHTGIKGNEEANGGFLFVGTDSSTLGVTTYILESPKFSLSKDMKLSFDVYRRSKDITLQVCLDTPFNCPYTVSPFDKRVHWKQGETFAIPKSTEKIYFKAIQWKKFKWLAIDNILLNPCPRTSTTASETQ